MGTALRKIRKLSGKYGACKLACGREMNRLEDIVGKCLKNDPAYSGAIARLIIKAHPELVKRMFRAPMEAGTMEGKPLPRDMERGILDMVDAIRKADRRFDRIKGKLERRIRKYMAGDRTDRDRLEALAGVLPSGILRFRAFEYLAMLEGKEW